MEEFPTSAELLEDRRKYAPVEWQTPEWEWVDPQSEQASAEQSIKTFMSDYQTELGSRGRSYRAVFYQRSKEERLRKQLGLLTPEEMQIAATAPPAEQQAAGPEAATTDVASQALNGAQVTSLVEILTQIGTGALPKDSAKAVVSAAFPTISQDTINSIVDPIEPGSIMADGSPVATDTANAQSQEDFASERGTGEMGSLSTLQFNRNRKAILKTLEDLAAGALTESAARVFLSSIGLSQANIDALIADASDGTIETNLDEVDA
jgi:hypothetical protein